MPSNTHTVRRLLPAASKPPITYRLPPAAAAADSSNAAGSDGSIRCAEAGEGDGEGDAIGLGDGDEIEGVGVAAACCGPAHESNGIKPKIVTARNRLIAVTQFP